MSTQKPVTASELKTFIEAVEFAADADEWIPSKRQWLRIREMIDALKETPDAPMQPPAPAAALPVQQYQPMPLNGGMSAFGPQHQPMQQIPRHIPIAAGAPNTAVRTPDVDSSNGQYSTPFA